MKKRFMQFVSAALALVLCVPPAWAVRSGEDDIVIRVGLASTSSHNELGVQEAAHFRIIQTMELDTVLVTMTLIWTL